MRRRHLFAATISFATICLSLWCLRAGAEEQTDPKSEAATFEAIAAGFQKLFNEGKAAELAASFLPDGELIDDEGNLYHGREELQTLAVLLALAWLAPNTQELMQRFAPALNAVGTGGRLLWRPSLGWALAIAVLSAIPLLQLNRVSEFLYYQF